MDDMSAALIIVIFVTALLAGFAAVNRRLGADPDLQKPWFPDNHWQGRR